MSRYEVDTTMPVWQQIEVYEKITAWDDQERRNFGRDEQDRLDLESLLCVQR